MFKYILLSFFIFISSVVDGDPVADSLELRLINTNNTRKKVDILNSISIHYLNTDRVKCYEEALKALELAIGIGYEEGIAQTNFILGDYYFTNNQIDSALNKYSESLSIYKGLTDDDKTGEVLLKIGSSFFLISNYKAALQYSLEALDIYQIINSKVDLAIIHSMLCDIYSNMGYKENAIEHCIQSLRLFESLDITNGKADLLNNIGNIYLDLGQLNKGEDFFNEALYLSKNSNDPDQVAYSLINLGNLLMEKEEFDKAREYYQRAFQIEEEEGNIEGQAYALYYIGITNRKTGNFDIALENMEDCELLASQSIDLELKAKMFAEYGILYSDIGMYDKAIEYLKRSLAMAQKIGANPVLQICYNNLAKYYDKLNDKGNALIYFKLYMLHKDEIFKNQSAQKIAETEALYSLEKKEQQIQLLRSQNRIKDLESSEKNLMNIWLFTGLIFVFTFSILVYRQYLIQGRANETLKKQQEAMNRQKWEIVSNRNDIERINHLLAEKNKEITDSIEYAKRIQLSLLPKDDILKDNFKDHFVLYLPKDIVSGDFYWRMKKEDTIYLAAVDCTGHGVPGAFMTVLANSFLNQLIFEKGKPLMPDQILNTLNLKVKDSLHQHGITLSAFEGMDISLLAVDLKKKELLYSGAKIPLYQFSKNEITQIAGDRFSVGGSDDSEKIFTLKKIKLKKDDIFYLATDGYQDQFGGENEKKFMKLHFRNLLKTIADLPMEKQEEKLLAVFNEWKKDYQQTDDILVMGIKI